MKLIFCPVCGKVMKYVSENDCEVPSETPRIVSEYECEGCQTIVSISVKC